MDPLRLVTTLSLLLAVAGIGGAFRACGSVAARGAARGAANSASHAVRIPPHVLRQLARTPPRVPIAIPTATGRAGENALRTSAAGRLVGGAGDDAARVGGRSAGRSGAARQGAGNLDSLVDVVAPDGDDDQPRPSRRKR